MKLSSASDAAKSEGFCNEFGHTRVTVTELREAWLFALNEIDLAIDYLESEKLAAETASRRAAEQWLATLYRDRSAYRALLRDHHDTCLA